MMGKPMYVLTEIRDVQEIDKTFTKQSFQVFERRFLSGCGSSDELLEKLYANLNQNQHGSNVKSFNRLTHDIHLKQLSPGGHLDEFLSVAKKYFETTLCMDEIINRLYVSRQSGSVDVSLMPFVSDFMVDANQRMFFGDKLSEMEPNLVWMFLELDDRIWQLLLHLPAMLAHRCYAARDKMISSIAKYFDLPRESRPNASLWLQTMEANMKVMGFSSKEMATVIVPMYIGSVCQFLVQKNIS
jgi:hypothetical protein